MRTRSWTRTALLRTAGLTLGCVSLALLPLLASGCGHSAEATAPGETAQETEVTTVYPQRMDLTREVIQPGELKPYEVTPIYTKIAGFAKEPRYDIGDRVKQGELLVELYLPEVETELKVREAKVTQAEAEVTQSEAARDAAKEAMEAARADVDAKYATIQSAIAQVLRWQAEDDRSKRLVGRGIYDQQTADEVVNQLRASEATRDETKAKWISAKATFAQATAQYEKAKADVKVADAKEKVAKADLKYWSDWLSYAQITAPYDGVITLRNVHKGHFLQPVNSGSTSKAAEPLFVLMRTDIMRCTIEVPEFDAMLIRDEQRNPQGEVIRHGDKALVRYQALPGVTTVGEVTRFSYSLDEHARTLRVEVHLPNPDGKFRPGTYVNVTILAKLRNVMALPADAIMSDILADGDRSYCYMVEDGKVHKTFLEIGAHCDEGVQVLRKQRPGGKWEEFTGKEMVVADPKKKEDGGPSRLVGPKALQDGQTVQVVAAAETH